MIDIDDALDLVTDIVGAAVESVVPIDEIFKSLESTPNLPVLLPCPLCGSKQVQLCGDRNNLSKATARCRECKCTGPLTYWQNRGFPPNVFTMP